MDMLPVTILPGKTFQGVTYFEATNFDVSSSYAFAVVARGDAEWNGKRFAKLIAEDIKRDIRASSRLMACRSFSDLHDICDANCLGGLCDEDERCKMIERAGLEKHHDDCDCHPVWRIDPGTEERCGGSAVGGIDVVAEAQELVDQWIKRGHVDE